MSVGASGCAFFPEDSEPLSAHIIVRLLLSPVINFCRPITAETDYDDFGEPIESAAALRYNSTAYARQRHYRAAGSAVRCHNGY